jgi:hypothetical protein
MNKSWLLEIEFFQEEILPHENIILVFHHQPKPHELPVFTLGS